MASTVKSHELAHRIETFFARFDHVVPLLDRISELATLGEQSCESDHLVIVGESGMGKSRIYEHVASMHPRVEHEEFTEVPVLCVSVPRNSTPKVLASQMLYRLGSRFWNKGGELELTIQLVTLLRACKVRLVMLDEVNHLADRGAAKTHYAVGDWLKQLTDTVRIPFVLAGIPRIRTLLDVNEQLRDRFRDVRSLDPLSVEAGPALERTRTVLGVYAKLLPEIGSVDITNPDVARSLVMATAGRLRPLRKLLVHSIRLACRKRSPSLGIEEFRRAFSELIFPDAPKARNPFHPDFNGMPLIKLGEPYAKEDGGLA